MSWESSDLWFDPQWTESTTITLSDASEVSVEAYWNFEADPLFSDRAAATKITFLIPTSQSPALLAQNNIAERANGDRYRIRSIDPTCGDGELTIIEVVKE